MRNYLTPSAQGVTVRRVNVNMRITSGMSHSDHTRTRNDRYLAENEVVMVTRDRMAALKASVESLLANTEESIRLTIVDNASKDKTAMYLKNLLGSDRCAINVISLKEDRGFAAALNVGIDNTDSPYVVIAGEDTLFTRGWFEGLRRVVRENPVVGIVTPACIEHGVIVAKGQTLDSFCAQMRTAHVGEFVEMPFVRRSCMMIAREVITQVGGFDNTFSVGAFECHDYSLRARDAGFLVGMARGVFVGRSEVQMVAIKPAVLEKGREAMIKKWGRHLSIAWVIDGAEIPSESLWRAIELVRTGNKVQFCVFGNTDAPKDLFLRIGMHEHASVSVAMYKNDQALAWDFFKKKQKNDVIIGTRKGLDRLAKSHKCELMREPDVRAIDALKKRGV